MDYSNLRIFGCEAYAHVPSIERDKLDLIAKKYIFVGYDIGVKVKGIRQGHTQGHH
ncbi:hypothetical protein PJP07_29920 [Mycobacterium kansasii]